MRAQVYRPLEFLFAVAAFTTLAENFLPQLIALPKARSAFGVCSDSAAVAMRLQARCCSLTTAASSHITALDFKTALLMPGSVWKHFLALSCPGEYAGSWEGHSEAAAPSAALIQKQGSCCGHNSHSVAASWEPPRSGHGRWCRAAVCLNAYSGRPGGALVHTAAKGT